MKRWRLPQMKSFESSIRFVPLPPRERLIGLSQKGFKAKLWVDMQETCHHHELRRLSYPVEMI